MTTVLVGPAAGPWCALLERLTRHLDMAMAYPLRLLLIEACKNSEQLTVEQRSATGQAARRLLEFAQSMTPRNPSLVTDAIESVCRTFESDPPASTVLIRRCLEPQHLQSYGFDEMPSLANEAARLISVAPDLVAEVYRAAFEYEESSTAPATIGSSQIISLVFDRRQQYEMARHTLSQTYPEFLRRAPRHATRALIAVVEAYVEQRHPETWQRSSGEVFEVGGRQARSCADGSAIWDSAPAALVELPIQMLNAFQHHMESLCAATCVDEIREIIDVLVGENSLAALWRRLLRAGGRHPVLAAEILPIARAVPILRAYDSSAAAGDCLGVVFPQLSSTERARIEQTIMSLPRALRGSRRRATEHFRDDVIMRLPRDQLVTGEARALAADLVVRGRRPRVDAAVEVGWADPESVEEEQLAREGVPLDAPVNQHFREIERPVAEFWMTEPNRTPTVAEVLAVAPAIQALQQAVIEADSRGVHPNLRDRGSTTLANAAEKVAKLIRSSGEDPTAGLTRLLLLEASEHPNPRATSEDASRRDDFPPIGHGPRSSAALGLIQLASRPAYATGDVLLAIERLSQDSHPAVRCQVGRVIYLLYETAPETMWRIIGAMATTDDHPGTLCCLLESLYNLAGSYPDQVVPLVESLLIRVPTGNAAQRVKEVGVAIVTGLCVGRGHDLANAIVRRIVDRPDEQMVESLLVLANLRGALTHGLSPVDERDPIRFRALAIVRGIQQTLCGRFRELEETLGFQNLTERDRERVTALVKVAGHLATELQLAVENLSSVRAEALSLFYREIESIVTELVTIGHAGVAHPLIRALQICIPVEPRAVFLQVGHVVRSAARGRYQNESMGRDAIVQIVERYLAEYRHLLQDDRDCQDALREVLEIFLRVGWPSARRLVYRLGEIFR